MTPAKTVKTYCAHCNGLSCWHREIIRDCQGDKAACGPCPFYLYRLGKRIPVRVFGKFCLQCMGGDRHGINECPSTTCPIYPYRFGTNPARQGMSGFFFQNAREPGEIRLESIFIDSEGKHTSRGPEQRLERSDVSPGRDPAG